MNKINDIRQRMIDIVKRVGKGHLGTSLSSLEIIMAIRDVMKEGDIFLSSKGHDALAQYAVLAEEGILDWDDVESFRTGDGLPSHPTVDIPGIAANTGSLGMGLSKALGFALNRPDNTIFVLLGDGEMMEGQNWEAALSISNSRIVNIVAVVDCNGFSQDDKSALSAKQIADMFVASGWRAYQLQEKHDLEDMRQAIAWEVGGQNFPSAILIPTTKGKGASFEGTWQSHAGPPRDDYSVSHPLYREFGEVVDFLMERDEDIVLFGADTLRDHNCYHLKEYYPDRIFDFGIAEQNMVSVASAMALEGKIPIVVTYAAFLRRAFEQIYNQVTEGTKVVYVGSMAGRLKSGGPGISHQSLDDIMYLSPWMRTHELAPSQSRLLGNVLEDAIYSDKTEYIRLLHHES